MLTAKNNVTTMRLNVLTKVAASFLNGFEDIDALPEVLSPDEVKPVRGSKEKDRQVLKEQIVGNHLGFAFGLCSLYENPLYGNGNVSWLCGASV